VKIGSVFPDLLTPLDPGASIDDTLARTLRRVVKLTGATAGALVFRPPRREPLGVIVGAPRRLTDWLARARVEAPPRSLRLHREGSGGRGTVLLEVPLGPPRTPVGALALTGPPSRLRRTVLPRAFPRELGTAIERLWALYEAGRRHTEELAALYSTSRLITARLELAPVLEAISRSVTELIGSTGCGIGLLDDEGTHLVHAAAHGFRTDAWRALSMPVGEGLIGRCAESGLPIRVDDIRFDPRSARRDVDEQEGIRSMLCVPLKVGGILIGVISAFSTRAAVFTAHHQELLEAFADQAAIALDHARLYAQLEARVTERTQELDEQKRFVEVVLETLPLGVFVLDAASRVIRVNREGARVLGCEGAGGSRFSELLAEDRTEAVSRFLAEVFASRGVRTLEITVTIAAELKTLRLTAAPVESAGEPVEHVVLLVEDITRAKRLEQQMLLTERLTTAGRLAAGVAHELNNPLATIAGCAEALLARAREDALGEMPGIDDFRRYLALIEEEAYRCKEITGSLLQFVREPGGRRTPTDLNALVVKTLELLSRQSRFAGRRLRTDLDPAHPAVTVNEGQMRQVFLGIAANALEAMGADGTLTIRSRQARDEIEIEFEDEGPGIADETLGRIFDPFFTTKPPGQGTGLGLAIAQGIVTDHGGRIQVTSWPGKGSTFRVVLPA
jgi:two-component system, NtrC family, sensor kinase